MEEIEKLGINSTPRFIELTSTITFKQQAELWLKSLVLLCYKMDTFPLERRTDFAFPYTLCA